jgi:CubicO group peptidase (beta-lactamase class C family)
MKTVANQKKWQRPVCWPNRLNSHSFTLSSGDNDLALTPASVIFKTVSHKLNITLKTFTLLLLLHFPLFLFAQVNHDLLDKELQAYIDKSPIHGMAVAICTPDSVLYAKGFGYANKEKKIPYSVYTFQPIASVTKTIVGFSLMKAQELKKLNLDDDINKYLPFKVINPHYPDEIITIRHLATHTSGLIDQELNLKTYVYEDKLPPIHQTLPVGLKRMAVKKRIKQFNSNVYMPMDVFLKNAYHSKGDWYSKKNFSNNRPGAYYEYSNNGAALASLVIEHATGIDFKTFVKQHILDPLKMDKSGWSLKDFPENERSALYILENVIPSYESITFPDGGFVTNISEFSNYMIAVMRGYNNENNLLEASSYQEMLKIQVLPEAETGIFWGILSKSIGHTGWDPGVNTLAYFSKSGSKGMIIFFNTTDYAVSMEHILEVLEVLKDNSKL